MRLVQIAAALAMALAASVTPACADVDTDFAQRLHSSGIYGPPDYDAWLGKIVCKRLSLGVDPNAVASVHFISLNLPHGTTPQQSGQFLAEAIAAYCPDRAATLSGTTGRGALP